jgi:hypothetical protein
MSRLSPTAPGQSGFKKDQGECNAIRGFGHTDLTFGGILESDPAVISHKPTFRTTGGQEGHDLSGFRGRV